MIGTVAIRLAAVDDSEMLGAIHARAWRETYAGLLPEAQIAGMSAAARSAQWRQQIARGTSRGVYLAEDDGEPIGFGACSHQRTDVLAAAGFTGEVTALYVLRAGQRRGAGTLLLGAMARRLIAEGERAMALWVLGSNAPARAFYEALGGVVVGRRGESPGRHDAPPHAPPPYDETETAYGWADLTGLAAIRPRH